MSSGRLHRSILEREVEMSKKSYRDLYVWRESVALVPDVYACVNEFPLHERFALANQIRRAVVSVPANIAEGHALYYRGGFLRHLCIARGSLAELQTLLTIAEQVGYVTPARLNELEDAIEGVARPLHRLIASVREKIEAEPRPRRRNPSRQESHHTR